MYRTTLNSALLLSASLLTYLGLPQPVAARRAAPSIRGSYFGSFQSTRGDYWTVDLTLPFQSSRRVSGQMNLAGIIREARVQGVFSPSQHLNLTATSLRGQRPLRLKLRGKATLEPESGRVVLSGSYVATGAMREKGTFELVGSNNGGPGL